MASIDLVGLSKVYAGGVAAVDNLSLTIAEGEFFALLGPSGCGKTTLLRTIAGLEEATSGQLLLGGKDVTRQPPGKRDVAMVFQDYALFPHMDVTDNISYPLKIQKMPKAERRAKAASTGAGLGLDELMDRRPGQLSGGQQQRVALARAIAYQPAVFLFDEPLSNLDARLRLEARTFLKRLQHDLRVTTVFVTHDQAEALAMADTIAVMEAGHIRQLGTPAEVFHRPANTFVANFIGSTPMNLVPGSAFGRDVVPEGDEVLVGFRPEYTQVERSSSAGRYALQGTVTIVENLGASMLVSVSCAGRSVQALVSEGEEPPVDAEVWVTPVDKRVLRYGAADGELMDAEQPATAGAAST
jgi:multiple sugar transport system ATP-binding protein